MTSSTAPSVLSVFSTFAVGGPQVRFAALANRFGPRWRHTVVAMDGRFGCAERLSPDIPLTQVPPPVMRGGNPLARLAAIRRSLGTLRPDVLITSNWGSIEWAMANLLPPRVRHIHMEDGFNPDEVLGQKPRRVLTRRLVLRGSQVVLPSAVLLGIARDTWRLPQVLLRHIPNGLDLTRFRPEGQRAELDVPGEGPLIGTVAALRAEKNLGRLLDACAILAGERRQFRLVVIGDGPQRDMLQARAHDLGLADRVRFPGHVPDPAAAYRAMEVFALSSDTEQMPFSVLEAMATALPVASTDVGDVRVMLAEGNAAHVVPRDPAALAAALRPLLSDGGLRSGLGAANRAKAVRDYDQETMFQAYAALIDGAA